MELIPRRRLRVAALVAALGLLATLLPLRPAPTQASWVDGEGTAITMTSGVLQAPTSAGPCVRDVWERTFVAPFAPAPAPSVEPTSYEWTLTHMRALSDPRVVASGTLPGDARAVTHTFSLGLLQVGTYELELVAHAGSWSEPLLGELYVIEGPITTRCDWL